MNNRFIRQSGLVDSAIFNTPLTVIGAGGIGSFTVLTLAKMGFQNIAVWDNDTVEEHNLASQFYRDSDIGESKVVALHSIVQDFCNIKINDIPQKWDKTSKLNCGIIVSAVDNMVTRQEMYDSQRRNPAVVGFVDGRMGGNQAEVYTVKTVPEKKVYEKTLWSEGEASEAPCTEKAIMYNVLWIASTIANNIRLMLSNMDYHLINIMDLQNSVLHQPETR